MCGSRLDQERALQAGKLTSSACLPPSYRTIKTLTFSRGNPVSDRIVVDGPSLLRHDALDTGRAAAFTAPCLEPTRPTARDDAVEDRRLLAAGETTVWTPRVLREARGPVKRTRGRERELSTILTVFPDHRCRHVGVGMCVCVCVCMCVCACRVSRGGLLG